MIRLFVALAALAAALTGLWRMSAVTNGLSVSAERVGNVPVTVFRPATGKPAPAVVIAHGFAGSQQLMQPFAVTLARNGFVAITFDFPGHGRNPEPLPGGLADSDARSRALLESLHAVAAFARGLPAADGRLALLGHSMASDIVVRYAREHPEVAATVAVSLFSREVTAASPRNLLVIDGALEPAPLLRHGYDVVGMAAGARAAEGVTYGRFADGTARRLALADGVEHIGVLYSRESLGEALAWLQAVFGTGGGGGFVDARGLWLALAYAGL
ncbi:MAG: alpha/beta hydrolase, partial [Pseudomonadota bacterium]